MKKTIDLYEFINEFKTHETRDNFTIEALEEIYSQWSELELDFDIVAIDCTYSENTLEGIKEEYENINSLEDLQDLTYAVELENGNILFNYNF